MVLVAPCGSLSAFEKLPSECVSGDGAAVLLGDRIEKYMIRHCCFSAMLSRQHSNTNVLALGVHVVGIELAKLIVTSWLYAEFEGGRHATRVAMLDEIK